jgi:organic hydroperoxide reductase OsmC/OhrA
MSKTHHFACRTVWTGARHGPTADYETYSRDIEVAIAGKPALAASSAGEFKGDESKHNHEDLLLVALSTCHMLSYLALAARARIEIVSYVDEATAEMAMKDGAVRFAEAMLRPRVAVKPGADLAKAEALHEKAHKICFIANSVNFPVRHEATIEEAR